MNFSFAKSFAVGVILGATGCTAAGTSQAGTALIPSAQHAHARAARDYATNPTGQTFCGAGSAQNCVPGTACDPLQGLDPATAATGAQCLPAQGQTPQKAYRGDGGQKIYPQCSSLYGRVFSLYHDCYVNDWYYP